MAGTPSYQRALGAEVRDLTLKEIRAVLLGEKDYGSEFKKALLLRLAGSALPRISEVTGEGGEPLLVKVIRANEN